MLAAKGQFLPLQAPLPSRATVGGILAADASGPSRLAYGSPRDWLIGIKVVHSNGVIAKSGGRVVKNVTGYDLNKLYVGSLGTLGVIVEAAFKVAPLSADDRTLVATYPTLGAAIHAARQLLCPSFTPHALVVIDREVATRLGGLGVAAHTEALLLALFAGRRAVVQRRADEAAAEVDRGGAVAVERLAHEDGVSLWQGVTDLGWTDDDARQLVVKVSGLPSQVRDLVALAGSLGPPTLSHGVVADVGYGSVRHLWWAQEGSAGQAHLPEEVVGRLREGARRCGAHVVVERCPVEVKDRIDVWGDSPEGIDIMRRIKTAARSCWGTEPWAVRWRNIALGVNIKTPLNSGPGFDGDDLPADEDLYRCIHCGLCLSSCPTYVETGLETESPRGRIALMKAVKEGRLGMNERVVSHWEMCLQCRACEAVCPSGVPFGRLMEYTRAEVIQHGQESWRHRLIRAFFLRGALPYPRRLRLGAALLRAYQRSGFRAFLRKSRLLKLLPGGVAELERGLPEFSRAFFGPSFRVFPARGQADMKVGLLSGCVMPLVHEPTMQATVRVLTRNGCDVSVPMGQGCCGALNVHSGDIATARKLARRNIDTFMNAGVERVVVASAGCGSTMKEYRDLLKDDPEYGRKAEKIFQHDRGRYRAAGEVCLLNPPRARSRGE